MTSITPNAAPTPIPALALLERPCAIGVGDGLEVNATDVAVGLDVAAVLLVDVLDVVDVEEIDELLQRETSED